MNKINEAITWIPHDFWCRLKENKSESTKLDLRKIGIDKIFPIITSAKDRGSSTQLRVFKIREPLNSKCYWRFIENEDIVLDLGANIGDTSVLSSNAKRIIAVEPLGQAIAYLKENLRLNGLDKKSEVIRMAVGKKGWLFLEENEKLNWSKIVDSPNERTQKVRSEPLSYFTKKYKTNMLRMDVEGYEYEILYKNIPKGINKISIEFHTSLLGKKKAEELIGYFYKEGFRIETLIEDLPIRLYPFLGFLRKTGLIKKFTFVKKNPSQEETLQLINKGRAQKYLFLRR